MNVARDAYSLLFGLFFAGMALFGLIAITADTPAQAIDALVWAAVLGISGVACLVAYWGHRIEDLHRENPTDSD